MNHMVFQGYVLPQEPINLPDSLLFASSTRDLGKLGASTLLYTELPSLGVKGGWEKPSSRKSFSMTQEKAKNSPYLPILAI